MERLTFDGLFCDIAKCDNTPGGTFCESGKCTLRKVWERLKEYEDAEQDGRLVVLPCKVGDTIYQIDSERVYWSEVKRIIFDCSHIAFDERAIGKSIFLTREEAEAALKGGADHA